MADVVVSHETVFELLRLERARTELQGPPKGLVGKVVAIIAKEKDAAKSKNLLRIMTELLERRERKVVLLALDKSKTQSAVVDRSRFLEHESTLFDNVLGAVEESHERWRLDAEPSEPAKETRPAPPARRMVRFLSPMPLFLGPELEELGPFDKDEVASVPSAVADVLVKKGRAQAVQPM